MLAFYNAKLEFKAEAGEFRLMVGSASDDIKLKTSLVLAAR
jgi:beta-glucosidase